MYIFGKWKDTKDIDSKSFVCWNCGKDVSSNKGYSIVDSNNSTGNKPLIYICHNCKAPNIYDLRGNKLIQRLPGKNIAKLPDEIAIVYNEARACMSVNAYTAAVMLFRKILMNISVNEGAEAGKDFKFYLGYLCKEGFVHKRQTKQAERIKDLGNEANHQIESRTKDEAENMLKFVEFLLLNNYEFADEIVADE